MVKSNLSSFAHLDDEPQPSVLALSKNGNGATESSGSADSPGLSNEELARGIVTKNILYSAGIVLVPFPVVDLVFSVGVHVNLIRELSLLYKIPFSTHAAKNVVYSMLGGIGTLYLGRMMFFTMVKMVPGAGLLASLAANPVASGAVTYALGNVFIMHFESGGTLLDFDPKKMKEFFRRELSKGVKESKTLSETHKDQ